MFKKSKFKIKSKDIKKLVTGMGACFATNMITIDGKPINFMYRETPVNENDSGWKFFSGYESDEHIPLVKYHKYNINDILECQYKNSRSATSRGLAGTASLYNGFSVQNQVIG